MTNQYLRRWKGRAVKYALLWIAMCLCSLTLSAQISSYQDQIAYELEKRGISEREFREILLDAGYDPDGLEDLSSGEVDDIQALLEDFERIRLFNQQRVRVEGDLLDTLPIDYDKDSIELFEVDSLGVLTDSLPPRMIYGHRLFSSGQIELIQSEGYRPPEDYVIGPGDELSVSIFGQSQLEETLVVQPDGSVRIRDGKVKVSVAGLDVQEARIKLERSYRLEYRFSSNQFSLYVAAVHTIRVEVFGEVNTPGVYTVSAINGVTNLLAGAGGLTDNASVRNIKVIHANGDVEVFDLYQSILNPQKRYQIALQNGDNIIVPTAQITVEIEGAIRRPHTYELKDGEGLFDLIEYAGGLAKGAYLRSMTVLRYEDDKRLIKDIPYAEIIKQNRNYPLLSDDQVIIAQIDDQLENYVSVQGEVRHEGNYELLDGMTLKDLISFAGVKLSTKTDHAFLKRLGTDGYTMIAVSLIDAINGTGESAMLTLQDRDVLIVYAKESFLEDRTIVVDGAVRSPESFEYDEPGALRAMDLINMAGGLRSDAAAYAHLHRLDPLNPNRKEYIHLDLARMKASPNGTDNIFLLPYDSLYVYSASEFEEEMTVKVSGAVNSPGTFLFGQDMTLKDAIILANGFKQSSATNKIEISRVIFRDNESTRTVIDKVGIARDQLHITDATDYKLEPFDNIFVRHVPQYELQQNVVIKGEVSLPGEYSLIKDNETIYDIIERAGGLTAEAFSGAATLYRSQDSVGYMVIRLEEVMANPASRFNQTLANGDTITIPKRYDQVTIKGATQYLQQNNLDRITVPFEEGKNAKYYIENYAGGFADNALKEKIFVRYPNGEVKTVKKVFPFGKKYPVVLPGSEINVWTERIDPRAKREEEQVNWTKVLGDSVAQAASILTLILLVQRLD